ncbi:sporulation peptidase YabG [Bacillus alveayuensis]|jgi:spore coat assemly protein|uniref:Spore coat assembly protein n=1 Tax=Aeribacillus alveayuensis TaxID=279215 RepID=A0ABT9VR10_9BACI|nr:sporulation peptidase YabG [Bacillus alveayuensis]MDQ0163423.1 spore coat assembly protein [Bacillus alveayuensis]
MEIKLGTIVARKSYKCDILFRVVEIKKGKNGNLTAILSGQEMRLMADAPYEDLVVVDKQEINSRAKIEHEKLEQSLFLLKQDHQLSREKQEYYSSSAYSFPDELFHIPGRVLHIDGDSLYLQKCLALYDKIGVPVYGVYCKEDEMPERVMDLLEKYRPDILVITGHDAYSKHKGKISDINAYRHSKHFVKTVRNARRKVPNLDQLVIFAGACQSHFESLIRAGANFASSPSRVNIHALDPVYIVAKISFTPFVESINVWEVLRNTLSREKGLGGIETRGVLRSGMPFKQHDES